MAEKAVTTAKAPQAKQTCLNSCKQNVGLHSSGSTADMILQLQRTAGNQAVQRLIKSRALQAKLKIGQPNDIYEQEADRVAEQVMRMPDPILQQQKESEEEKERIIQTKPLDNRITHIVQRRVNEEEEEEEPIQRKEAGSQIPDISPDIHSKIKSLRGSDQPLPESTRAFFEPRFGQDFSRVRLRTDTNAGELARAINARAFTVGQTISFGSGQYSPETSFGKRLLAHELTHVTQQGFSETANCSRAILQRFTEGVASTKSGTTPGEKQKLYPPVNWTIDRAKNRVLAIPKSGVSLQDVAQFLYGDSTAVSELASVNKISPSTPLLPGLPLQLTGKKLTQEAFSHLNASPKIPLGIKDPEAFLAKKKNLDAQLENDFNFIVSKLNEAHYSDSDEGEVIKILRKWAEEKFAENPTLYPAGGEYLDKLFAKLTQKTKDVGVVTTQVTNYYSLIFNHFDRVTEVRFIRDVYSRNFKGDNGRKELSFGSYFWEQVKEGKVRDQIFAYFKGLGKGIWSGAKGTVMMAYTLITDPKKFLNDLKNLPSALRTMWEKRSDLWNKFASAPPEEQAEMIGKVFGEIEFMIGSAAVGGATAKGVERLTEIPGTVGNIAKTVQVVTKLPQTALGALAKGVKTVVVMGVKGAAEGAKFAARGIYRIGKAIFRGTWSVVEKTVEKITKRVYYFFDDAAGVLREIPAKFAKKCVKCSSPCELTKEATKLSRQEELQLLKEYEEAGKITKVTEEVSGLKAPGMSSTTAETAEEILIGSAGESIGGAEKVLRNLLAVKGTLMHEQVYQALTAVATKVKLGGTVFTEKMWPELEKVLGVQVPWRRGKGPDILIVVGKHITPLDVTRVAGRAGHITRIERQMALLSRGLKRKGWTFTEKVIEREWVGRTARQVVDEMLMLLQKLA